MPSRRTGACRWWRRGTHATSTGACVCLCVRTYVQSRHWPTCTQTSTPHSPPPQPTTTPNPHREILTRAEAPGGLTGPVLLAADVFSLGASAYEVATGLRLKGSGPEWHRLREGGLPEVSKGVAGLVFLVFFWGGLGALRTHSEAHQHTPYHTIPYRSRASPRASRPCSGR